MIQESCTNCFLYEEPDPDFPHDCCEWGFTDEVIQEIKEEEEAGFGLQEPWGEQSHERQLEIIAEMCTDYEPK